MMRKLGLLFVVVAAVLLVPATALADPTHELEVVNQTKTLLADVAYYLKFILPGLAICYAIYGGLLRTMAGDDEMKKSKADRTLTNAKMGLVIGFVAAPLLAWLQKYYS